MRPLQQPRSSIDIARRAFSRAAPTLWNNLPIDSHFGDLYIYVYSSRRQNTAKIQTDRHTDRQTLELIPQQHNNSLNIHKFIHELSFTVMYSLLQTSF